MLKIILAGIIFLAILLYLIIPAGFGIFASLRMTRPVGSVPEGCMNLQLTTIDNVKLAAWYMPPKNGAVIILIHGGNGSRESVRPYLSMLKDNGFGVLAFDLSGHGESGGGANAFGWNSNDDIGAAVTYLEQRDEVKAIGGLGISLGGEALLSAASSYPQIKAVVSDGATYRCTNDYVALPSRNNIIHSWTHRVMYTAVRIFTRDTPPIPMKDSVKNAQGTSLFLIAAGKEKDEIEYNQFFLETAGDGAELWVVPQAQHTGAFRLVQADYERRVIKFFQSALFETKVLPK